MDSVQMHTVRSFDQELDQLSTLAVRMGKMSVSRLDQAVRVVGQGNIEEVRNLIAADAEIDALEQEIHSQAVRIIALRQPMADDLRAIVCALKISSDFERIGDYAANICKRGLVLEWQPSVPVLETVSQMARLVQELMSEALHAYQHRDEERAKIVRQRDREIDGLFSTVLEQLISFMGERSQSVTACTHLIFIAKGLERAGDHIVTAAETIHFLITGRIMSRTSPYPHAEGG